MSEEKVFCTCEEREKTSVQKFAPACIDNFLNFVAFTWRESENKNKDASLMH